MPPATYPPEGKPSTCVLCACPAEAPGLECACPRCGALRAFQQLPHPDTFFGQPEAPPEAFHPSWKPAVTLVAAYACGLLSGALLQRFLAHHFR